jgi:hypothetical protein
VKVESSLFAKHMVAMAKSINFVVISSSKSTLLGFKSQWITYMKQW